MLLTDDEEEATAIMSHDQLATLKKSETFGAQLVDDESEHTVIMGSDLMTALRDSSKTEGPDDEYLISISDTPPPSPRVRKKGIQVWFFTMTRWLKSKIFR